MTAKPEDLNAVNTKIVVDHPAIQKEGVSKLLQLLQKASSPIYTSATQLYNLVLSNISNPSIAVAESCLSGVRFILFF